MDTYTFVCLCFVLIVNTCISRVNGSGGRQGEYSNEWLLQTNLTIGEVREMARHYGLEYSHEVLPGFYVLRLPSTDSTAKRPYILSTTQRRIADELRVETMRQQRYVIRERRGRVTQTINITDSSWPDMWYLHQDRVPNMNVYEAWEMGYSGAGIQVAVLDDGIEMNHPDLVDNYVSQYSYDYLYENTYPVHNGDDFHGTWCTGIISASKNNECIVGVAFNSKFSAVKTMDSSLSLTPSGEAMALVHELPHVDIYSISWGPSDNGRTFEAPDEVTTAAFIKGVTEGRKGKGAIYAWAAGNGGRNQDNCNCDGFVGSIYTIGITSISADLQEAWYAERCTAIMAGNYGGDAPANPGVSTTDLNGGCTKTFDGTSATCPMATGIIAMVLEANPNLTWRDVQYLIVETSSHEHLNRSTSISGAGKQVNQYFGFGLMNAEAMINLSLSWKTVPDQKVCISSNITVDGLSINGSNITSGHMTDGCSNTVRYLEHVQARVVFQTIKRGVLEIFLTSPSGLESQLLTSRPYDRERKKLDWTFMTVHHWGEDPTGEWQLRVQTTEPDLDNGTVEDKNNTNNIGALVGGILGSCALVGVVVAIITTVKFYRPNKITDNEQTTQGSPNGVHVDEEATQGNPSGLHVDEQTTQGNHFDVHVGEQTTQRNPTDVHVDEQTAQGNLTHLHVDKHNAHTGC